MIKKQRHIIILLCTVTSMYSQDSVEKIFNRFSSQSFVKQNTYLLNPTFTVVNETGKSIALLSRNSFIGFEDSPVVNILGFSGKISENIGAGVGVYRQTIGVFTNFGAIANYAYRIKLSTKSSLSLGFNFMFSHIDIDRTRILDPTSDPVIFNFQEKTNIILQTALSYNYGKFNICINLRDVVDYNIKEGEFITPFSEKAFSIHAQYSEPLNSNIKLLEEGVLRFFYSANHNTNSSFTGNILLDLPKLCWLQGGYDGFFGSSAGVGIRLSQKVAISYVYETGKNDLGPTSEIGIIYSFSKKPKNPINYSFTLKTDTNSKPILKEDDKKIIVKDTLKTSKTQIKAKEKKTLKQKHSLANKLNTYNNVNDTLTKEDVKKFIVKDSLNKSNTRSILKNKEGLEIKDSLKVENKKPYEPKTEVIKNSKELEEGFYLIVNVFARKRYAESFIKELEENNLTPNYFIHPIKKYRYVYISYSKDKKEILKLIYNNVNGKYIHEKWILQVEN